MKKYITLGLILLLLLAGCGANETPATTETTEATEEVTEKAEEATSEEVKTLRIGASPVPHADILKVIEEDLLEKGYKLEIVEFTDYVLPNLSLDEGDLEANFFQHKPYLENFNEERGTKLVSAGDVHVEPIGLYSASLNSLDDVKDGDVVALPGDATNGGRSLLLLEQVGLIKLKEGVGLTATVQDVEENPKNLSFKELEAAQIPRALDDVALAAINTNYALAAELDPKEALATEEAKDNPYANALVVREEDKDAEFVKVLVELLQSDKVKEFIETEYQGAILAAF